MNTRKHKYNILTALVIFTCTVFIYTDFNIRQFLGYGLLLLYAALHLRTQVTLSQVHLVFVGLVASIALFALLPNVPKNKDIILYVLEVIIFMLILLTSSHEISDVEKALNIFQGFGVCLAFTTLFFKAFPGMYWRLIFPLLSSTTADHALKYIPHGYGIPIAAEFLFANYIFASTLVITLGKIMYGEKRYRKKEFAILIFIACGMLLYGRRSELVSTAGMFILLLLIQKRIHFKMTIRARNVLIFAVALIVSCILFRLMSTSSLFYRYAFIFTRISNVIHQDTHTTFSSLLGGSNDITSGRVELWSIAVKKFLQKPIFGNGWASFGTFVPAEFNNAHSVGNVLHAHNDYLEHLCEVGIVGTVLLLAPRIYLIILAIKQALRIKRYRTSVNPIVFQLNFSSLGIQLFLLLQGMIDPCFYKTFYWCFYTVSIAFLEYALYLETRSESKQFTSLLGIAIWALRKNSHCAFWRPVSAMKRN